MAPAQVVEPKDLPPELQGTPVPGAEAAPPPHPGQSVAMVPASRPAVTPGAMEDDHAPGEPPVGPASGAALAPMPAAGWLDDLALEARRRLEQAEPEVWDRLTRQFEGRLIQTALSLTRGRRIEAAQHHHRCVIAGPFVLARQLVDAAGLHLRPQRLADQDVVDAQALVLAEGQVAVVPPAPALGRLLEEPEGVRAGPGRAGPGNAPLLGRAMDLPGPGHGVVDVAVFGGDVEVAHQHQLRVRGQLGAHPVAQRVEPAHLVGELVAVGACPLGK
jgi:hypothetical protein